MDQLKDFVTKSIRETISASSSSKRKRLDDIAEELAKDFSDDDFFSYHRIIKVGSSPFNSYCQVRFKASEEEIQAVVSEINKAAGIDVSDTLPPVVVVDAPSSSDFFRPIIDFVKRQYDLNRGISGLEYFVKTSIGSFGVSYLILLIASGAWSPWYFVHFLFIPFIYFSSAQRINKLGFDFGVTYISVAAIIGWSILIDAPWEHFEFPMVLVNLIYAFFVLAGLPKWVKKTFEEAQNE